MPGKSKKPTKNKSDRISLIAKALDHAINGITADFEGQAKLLIGETLNDLAADQDGREQADLVSLATGLINAHILRTLRDRGL